MTESTRLPPVPTPAARSVADRPLPVMTPAAEAALAAAQALARKATAAATLRAYKADWTHYAAWCADHGFIAVPAAPATVGAYLASLAGSHAPTTIRRRLAASPPWAKCTGSMTCHGTRGTTPFRGHCRARCAATADRCKKLPP